MARKALLIGSATDGLIGVENDVNAMEKALARWRFTSVRCEREKATRAEILDAYEKLISQAQPDDAIVIFYSGHGGYAPDPELGHGTPGPGSLQLIVPTDHDETTETDFRYITAPELSVLLARLTERTTNVTVVLDCCHAGHMSRVEGQKVRGLPRAVNAHLVQTHLDNLRAEGLAVELWSSPGNPHAVRMVACAPEQRAFEAPNADGEQMGYLTDALTRTLDELRDSGLNASWATVADRVRQRVLAVWTGQRPEVEGPAQRIVFSTDELEPLVAFPVSLGRDGIARITGATLTGVRRGDQFAVMPDDSPVPDDRRKLGDVLVDRVDAQAAYGRLVPATELPMGARAHLVRTALPALPVHLPDELASVVDAVPYVQLATPDSAQAVRVEANDDGLTVHDDLGPLHAPRTQDAAGTTELVSDLTRLGRAHALKRLTEPAGLALTTPVSIAFSRVVRGVTTRLPLSGATIHSGQSICVEVRNDGHDTVYVSLLDIGVSAKISVLHTASPFGVRLDPGVKYVFGADDMFAGLPGLRVGWPDTVPGGGPRQETILVLVTEEPTETRMLEQRGFRGCRADDPSQLEHHLSLLGLSPDHKRDITPPIGRPVRFAVHSIDFDLAPDSATPERAEFQVDDRPVDGAVKPIGRTPVTLSLSELVAHHNRSSRDTDVRLDALVITSDSTGRPTLHTRTEHFSGITDGAGLALSGIPVFRGDAHDQLDIAVWISANGQDLPDLGTLLRHAAPTGAEVSTMVDSAHQALGEVLDKATGVYRNTVTDRMPGSFVVRAQDFTFRCAVTVDSGPSGTGQNPRP
ncbi:caspase family protein [Lentzea sp. NPDC005914]|uniref:caspase family protein n=1 Tax=Lentzea sp. NPDC005914 TaxID=3154572 RepID=UPI0033CC6886